jgi:hypothetical protein
MTRTKSATNQRIRTSGRGAGLMDGRAGLMDYGTILGRTDGPVHTSLDVTPYGPTSFVKRALIHPPQMPGFPGQNAAPAVQPTTQAAPTGQNGPGRPAGSSSAPSSGGMGGQSSSTSGSGAVPMMPAQPIAASVPPKAPEKGFGNDAPSTGTAKMATLSGSQLAEALGAITAGLAPLYVPRNKTAAGPVGRALGGLGGGVAGGMGGALLGAGLGGLLGRYAGGGVSVDPETAELMAQQGVNQEDIASAGRMAGGVLGAGAGGLAGGVGGVGLGALLGIHATRDRKPKDQTDMSRKGERDDD